MPNKRAQRHTPPAAAAETEAATALERALAYAIVTCLVLSLIGFAMSLTHWGFKEQWPWLDNVVFANAFWGPMIALPLGFASLITLLIVSAAHKGARSRE